MQAGKLRHRVQIEEPIKLPLGPKGQPQVEWRPFSDTLAATCFETGSREVWFAQQVQPETTLVVELRWRPGVTAAMRLIWLDGTQRRTLNIMGPPTNPDGRKIKLVLTCVEEK